MKTKIKKTEYVTSKTEYQVRYIRKDHLWQVKHVHNYPNYSMNHPVYTGSSWDFCMWIATGDPFYLDRFNLSLLAGGRLLQCGMRVLNGHANTGT